MNDLLDTMVNAYLASEDADGPGVEWHSDAVRRHLTAALAIVEGALVKPMLKLLSELTDPDDCWYDHNGGCQAHGFISLQDGETCPHADAKKVLATEGVEL